jgi:hypothetical protein
MRKSSLLLLSAVFFLVCDSFVWARQGKEQSVERIVVVSDVHIMDPALLKKEGKPFNDYVADDRKMLREGPEILDSVMQRVEDANVKVLLICGDLTKDGETASHHYLVDHYLEPARRRGMRLFVVHGNHDVNNPHAREFDGDRAPRLATVSKEEFARIYKNFGYGEAIARDSYSLSYVVQLDRHTRLIAIDACKYEENNFDKNYDAVSGRIKPQTMSFICSQAFDAKVHGYKVIAMMHHGVVRHWVWQDRFMKEYLVDNWKSVARKFAKWGIKVVFTGHFHAQDAASMYGLTDVQTGSTVSYPQPYRIVDIDERMGQMHIKTGRASTIASLRGDSMNLDRRSERAAHSALNGVAMRMLLKKIHLEVRQDACKVLGEAYAMHMAGDEKPSKAFLDERKRVGKEIHKCSIKWGYVFYELSKHLSTDTGVADNNLTVSY